jgi:hypothetical protein
MDHELMYFSRYYSAAERAASLPLPGLPSSSHSPSLTCLTSHLPSRSVISSKDERQPSQIDLDKNIFMIWFVMSLLSPNLASLCRQTMEAWTFLPPDVHSFIPDILPHGPGVAKRHGSCTTPFTRAMIMV